MYVYRGNEYEKIQDFVGRIQTQFPNAEPMQKLTPPSAEIKESPQQCEFLLTFSELVIYNYLEGKLFTFFPFYLTFKLLL